MNWSSDADHTLEGGFHRIERHLTPEESKRYLAEGWRVRIVKSVILPPIPICMYRVLDKVKANIIFTASGDLFRQLPQRRLLSAMQGPWRPRIFLR